MSNPMFEASVRLQLDIGDFESQAKQSIQRVLDKAEQDTQAAIRSAQQRVAQVSTTTATAQPPTVPPVTVPPIVIPTEVEPPVVPTIEPEPIEVPLTVVDGGGVSAFLDSAVSKAAQAKQALVNLRIELAQVAKDLKTREAEQEQAIASGPLFAQAFERREPVLAETGQDLASLRQRSQELREQVALAERASKETQQQLATAQKLAEVDEQILASRQLAAEARSAEERAASAGLAGDPETQAAQQFQAEVLGRQARIAALNAEAQQTIALAAQVGGEVGATLQAEGTAMLDQAERLRGEIERLQAARAAPVTPGGGGGDGPERGDFGDIVRRQLGGRTTGLGGLIGGAARFGLAGFAFSAAFQGFQEVQQALRVTGDEAFTMEGKFRNAGAELLTGNFIGAFKALNAQRPAELTQGVTAAIEELNKANDPLVVSEEKLIAKFNEGGDSLEGYLATLEFAGAISGDTADDLEKVAATLAHQKEAADAAALANIEYARTLESVGGIEARLFGERGDRGQRGPGAIPPGFQAGQGPVGQVVGQQRTGIPRDIVTAPFANEVFQAGTGGQEAANRIRESLNQRLRSEEERLQADLRSARIIERQARANFDAAKKAADGSGQAADEYEKLVTATTALGNAAAAVKEQATRAAQEIQDANDRIANARVSAIRDPTAQASAQLALDQARQAREGNELEQARADFAKKKIDAVALKQAEAEYAEAVAATKTTQNQIADAQEAASEAAATSARNATEAALENNIAAAALTKRKSDDKKFFDIAIGYYRDVAAQAATSEEREQAQAKILDLRKRRAEALTSGASATGEDLELLRIQNRIAAAGLTDRISDDKRFTRELIAYWREKVVALRGEAIEQEKARAQLIAARRALKGLQEQQGESPEVFAQSLFQRAVDEFRSFGSNITGSPNGILAPQDARGFFAGSLLGGGFDAQSNVERVAQAQLSESTKQTSLLTQIATNTSPTPVPTRKEPQAPEEGRVTVDIGSAAVRGM